MSTLKNSILKLRSSDKPADIRSPVNCILKLRRSDNVNNRRCSEAEPADSDTSLLSVSLQAGYLFGGEERASSTPTALCPPAQGCPSPRGLPWANDGNNSQPQRGCVLTGRAVVEPVASLETPNPPLCDTGHNPVGVGGVFPALNGCQAGGLADISRWLSEARQATPPVFVIQKNRIPEGCQMARPLISGIPPGCGVLSMVIRWCRSFLAQPPANIHHASGMKNHQNNGKPNSLSRRMPYLS